MKFFLIFGLSLLTIQPSFSSDRSDLSLCLKESRELRKDLNECRKGSGPIVVDDLKKEIQDLKQENSNLRLQLEQTKPSTSEVFSYATCADNYGYSTLKQISSGVAASQAEAEMKAILGLKGQCREQVKIVKSEQITSKQALSYCTAACADNLGYIYQMMVAGSSGKNVTEASYLALKKVVGQYNCLSLAKIVSCQ